MSQRLNVTYYYHSGFSVAKDGVLLIFDYWLGEKEELPERYRVTPELLAQYQEVYVFISHEHPDHLDPVVFTWQSLPQVRYIVSSSMPEDVPGQRMSPYETLAFPPHMTVKAYDSTDLGVSFMVDLDGVKIFHAGDLNFWHWREESTAREIEESERAFRAAMEPLYREPVDVAFFPADPRQGMLFDAGANYYMMSVKPRLLLPMHFFDRGDLVMDFARRSRSRETEIVALVAPGDYLTVDMEDDGLMSICIPSTNRSERKRVSEVDLQGYQGGDPFNETDLPVDMTGQE